MIAYFSGTGNSRYAAEALAFHLADEAVPLDPLIRSGGTLSVPAGRPFVLAAPIYAWGLPDDVMRLVRSAEIPRGLPVYAVVTMGSQTGAAARRCRRAFAARGADFRGLCGVAMPNNFIVGSGAPAPDEARAILAAADGALAGLAEAIRSGRPIAPTDRTPLGPVLSGPVHAMFTAWGRRAARSYRVTGDCVSCGKCARDCPKGNVVLRDGRPVFGKNCMFCLSCLQHCPAGAIQTGKSAEKRRWICPPFSPDGAGAR